MRLSSITTDRRQGRCAFFQAWEIFLPPNVPLLLAGKKPSSFSPLIRRSDEFRSAIPRQVARQQSPPPLRRPLAMLANFEMPQGARVNVLSAKASCDLRSVMAAEFFILFARYFIVRFTIIM